MLKMEIPSTFGTNSLLAFFAEACGGVENPRLFPLMEEALDNEILIRIPFGLSVARFAFLAKELANFEDWARTTFKKTPKVMIV